MFMSKIYNVYCYSWAFILSQQGIYISHYSTKFDALTIDPRVILETEPTIMYVNLLNAYKTIR